MYLGGLFLARKKTWVAVEVLVGRDVSRATATVLYG